MRPSTHDVLNAITSMRDEHTGQIVVSGSTGIKTAVEQLERGMIVNALREHQGNQTRAAAQLGITRQAAQQRFRDPDDAPIPVAVRANYMTWWWDNERPALIESGDIEELDGQLRGRTPEGRELLRTMGFDLD